MQVHALVQEPCCPLLHLLLDDNCFLLFGCGNSDFGFKKKYVISKSHYTILQKGFIPIPGGLVGVILLIQLWWCIVLAACHTQNSTSGHPAGGKRPIWPVAQQLGWQANALRTATIVYVDIFRNTHVLCVCVMCITHTYNAPYMLWTWSLLCVYVYTCTCTQIPDVLLISYF